MQNAALLYGQLVTLGPLQDGENAAALKRIGLLVDLAGDLGRQDGTTLALEWGGELGARKLNPRHRALLEYFVANAWHNRQRERHRHIEAASDWEQPELLRQVYHLRAAARLPGFDGLPPARQCQILTNLGNQLSAVGRFVEARATWTRALAIGPHFGMALGNRGSSLLQYARSHYDQNQAHVMLTFAHDDLTAALGPRARYHGEGQQGAMDHFAARRAQVERCIDVGRVRRNFKLDAHSLGKTAAEQDYRRWVPFSGLRNRHSLSWTQELSQGPRDNAAAASEDKRR